MGRKEDTEGRSTREKTWDRQMWRRKGRDDWERRGEKVNGRVKIRKRPRG